MKRLLRLRSQALLRELTAENGLTLSQLIQPLFVGQGLKEDLPILGLRDTQRQSVDGTLARVEKDLEAGVKHFILFPVPNQKASHGFSLDFTANAISSIKKRFGNSLFLWVDTCLCSYTDHGHCCVMGSDGRIDLEPTLKELGRLGATYAQAGADGISPSDMMDGRTAKIREDLDHAGKTMVPIMSYSTKFASQMYGPFRQAADSAPQYGDRKGYQIDVRNRTDALASSDRCAEEGADLLMVKPGMTSIDLIREIYTRTGRPVGAYQVSGEFASLTLLAEKGLTQFEPALLETWNVFKRAGAQYIITYGARYAKSMGVAG